MWHIRIVKGKIVLIEDKIIEEFENTMQERYPKLNISIQN